jgi:hypothetical protein
VQTNVNPYKNLFKQGATIVPRTFYFVELNQETPSDFKDRIINVKTPDAIIKEAKKPWNASFKGQIESEFLFLTALSKSILPFALYKPDLVVLPVSVFFNRSKQKSEIKMHSHEEIRRKGDLKASNWFRDKEHIWELLKTAKSKKMSNLDRLNFQRGLTEQNLDAQYLVLYNSSAKDANALVVNRKALPVPKPFNKLKFIVESKAYVYYTNNMDEAFYLAAILNSSTPNLMMKDYQTKGLFGARDVHKKILDIYFPKFNENHANHLRLADLSQEAHRKAEKYLKAHPPQQELSALHLGRLRVAIKKHLAAEMKEIDKLVKKLIG